MWFRRKPRETPPQDAQWVVVAQYHPILNAVEADMAVSILQGQGIPAARFPTNTTAGPFVGIMGPEPIRVLVPPDRAEEARQLLAEEGTEDDEPEDSAERPD